ncbi:N-ethylmaleimide reductase [Candidatus Desulfarcum epimagneticum]|uniref:N-ethylmaleimide reductase n=1 Tax=uncultured Desulfobacteraceae bacterium TaxID=218296 RepID=A0A484HMB8_9BACT|nr:N-ethylmaleimide reductase [uncultured Desulfobacteraceae bacterium]
MSNPILFEPVRSKAFEFKNRIALAPMTRARAGESRVPNDLMARYYHQRSGAGLMVTEATVVSEKGLGWVDSPGIYTDEMVEGWRKTTEKIAPAGARIFLQLWHCGRASHSDFFNGAPPVSASAVKLNGDFVRTPFGEKPYETPRPLSEKEIKDTVADYRKAAENAKKAGFDGVEVHGANGYLINQFLDSKTNLRQDRYGGSVQNRFRFFKEILDAALDVWGPGRVGARISPNGVFNDMGGDDFRETYLHAAREMDALDLAYLHIMDGLAFGFHEKGEPMTLEEFRAVYSGLIVANCGYDRKSAEEAVSAGRADMVAFGRPFISNPDLPERFKNNWPLTPWDDMSGWYSPGPGGYADYEPFDPSA